MNAVRCWMCCVVPGLVVVAVVSLMMCFGTLAHMCTAGELHRHPVNAVRCCMCCVVPGLVVVAVVSLMMCFGTLAHMCTAGTQ